MAHLKLSTGGSSHLRKCECGIVQATSRATRKDDWEELYHIEDDPCGETFKTLKEADQRLRELS